MFTSQKQLKSVMKEILETLQQGKDIKLVFAKYPEESYPDLLEALDTCISHGYLTGITYAVGAQGDIVFSTSGPHVTASGNEFISEI